MNLLQKILILLNLIATLSFAQDKFHSKLISHKTKEIVKQIKSYKTICFDSHDNTGTTPEQYKLFEKFTNTGNVNEFYELTNHKSPAVRIYAFRALLEKDLSKAIDVFRKNALDTATVEIQAVDIFLPWIVIGHMYSIANRRIQDNKDKLSEEQLLLVEKTKQYLEKRIRGY